MRQASAGAWSSRRFDWPTLVANKDAEITRLEGLYRAGLERAGVTILQARAELADPHTVIVQPGGRKITARYILIATGGRPVVPDVPGAGHAITSNEAFHLDSLPKSILIVGGGYIAVEFAGIFAGLGVDTTLLYRGAKILRGFDEELRDNLTQELFKREIDVRCNAEIAAIEKARSRFKVTLKDGSTIDTGQVMYATGRSPNTAGIGLEAAGVKLGEKGEVLVDAYSRTSVEHIYAVGDVTDRVNLTPVAIREGHAFADTVFGNKPTAVDHELVPTAVFSTPEIGTVGLTEAEARERFPKLDIYKARFRPLKYTLSGRDEPMLMKLLVDGESGRVVGCHVLGADAAEIVQMAAIAMKIKATKADFDATVALHPERRRGAGDDAREVGAAVQAARPSRAPRRRREPHAASGGPHRAGDGRGLGHRPGDRDPVRGRGRPRLGHRRRRSRRRGRGRRDRQGRRRGVRRSPPTSRAART